MYFDEKNCVLDYSVSFDINVEKLYFFLLLKYAKIVRVGGGAQKFRDWSANNTFYFFLFTPPLICDHCTFILLTFIQNCKR